MDGEPALLGALPPHLHLLLAEAQWEEDGTVVAVAPPGDEDVARILARVLREAKKGWAELDAAWPERARPLAMEQRAMHSGVEQRDAEGVINTRSAE